MRKIKERIIKSMFACACGNNEWQWQSMHVNVGDNVSGVFNLLKPRQRERESAWRMVGILSGFFNGVSGFDLI